MKIKPIVFSISGAIIISLFFTLSLFWIFYEYSGSQNSTKDAISTLSGYFGGIATLWAAIIAAYLFNDWRIQHNKNLYNQFALRLHQEYILLDKLIRDFGLHTCEITPPRTKWKIPFIKSKDVTSFSKKINELSNLSKNIDLQISVFLDSLREFSVISWNEEKIDQYIKAYLAEYIRIQNTDFFTGDSLQEYVNSEVRRYDEFANLKLTINIQIILPLLRTLHANSLE